MSRIRNAENKGLPARWVSKHGSYYFCVPKGQEAAWDGKSWFPLGKTLPDAYKAYAARVAHSEDIRTIGQLLDRYALEVIPDQAASRRDVSRYQLEPLRKVFGALSLSDLTPALVYKYATMRSVKKEAEINGRKVLRGGKSAAKHEVALLRHAFTKAVEWGLIDAHPFRDEVELKSKQFSTPPRDRYVEDWEVAELAGIKRRRKGDAVPVVHAYLALKLLTPMRQSDLLKLRVADGRGDGIHVEHGKTAESSGKKTIYEWSDELRAAWDAAKAARPCLSPYLFCTRRGESYWNAEKGKAPGFKSLWQRFMARVLTETKITDGFTEHDLRAKAGSDAETLERARALLGHSDARVTQRVYRRRPERVAPAK